MIGSFLLRILAVGFGFVLAGLCALSMLVFLGGRELSRVFLEDAGASLDEFHPVIAIGVQVWGALQFAAALGPALTILPAIAVIVIGEVAHIRSSIYYMLAGGLAILAIPLLYETEEGISGAMNAHYIILFCASGFVAGFVYWLVAGRRA